MFLKHKDESHFVFNTFYTQVKNEKNLKIIKVKSDHGGEFQNKYFENNGIYHDFSCPITPLHNGVVEQKNCTLQEMDRTMTNETNMEKHFWT